MDTTTTACAYEVLYSTCDEDEEEDMRPDISRSFNEDKITQSVCKLNARLCKVLWPVNIVCFVLHVHCSLPQHPMTVSTTFSPFVCILVCCLYL